MVEVESPDPLLVVSSEGSAMYGTTDLATILQRVRDQKPDLMLYVVDQRQADHFEQVFRAAAKAGYVAREALEHIGFGTMNGPDGKPFKTREGGVLKLHDLIGQAERRRATRLHEAGLGEELPAKPSSRTSRTRWPSRRSSSPTSRTSAARPTSSTSTASSASRARPGRTCSTRRSASKASCAARRAKGVKPGPIAIEHPAERTLALALDGFDQALRRAYDKKAPHFLAEHAYALAQAFSGFYANCPILPSEGALRASPLGARRRHAEAAGVDAGFARHRRAGADVIPPWRRYVRRSPRETRAAR